MSRFVCKYCKHSTEYGLFGEIELCMIYNAPTVKVLGPYEVGAPETCTRYEQIDDPSPASSWQKGDDHAMAM